MSREDQVLQIGQAAEQVEVSASNTRLQTDKADTPWEISSKQVRDIPLGGQRSYQALINLTPGSTPAASSTPLRTILRSP